MSVVECVHRQIFLFAERTTISECSIWIPSFASRKWITCRTKKLKLSRRRRRRRIFTSRSPPSWRNRVSTIADWHLILSSLLPVLPNRRQRLHQSLRPGYLPSCRPAFPHLPTISRCSNRPAIIKIIRYPERISYSSKSAISRLVRWNFLDFNHKLVDARKCCMVFDCRNLLTECYITL